VTYPSEAVREVLERTLGVPIFQEQVMQLAVVAAGFTPGEADQLRRSMAAWRRKGGLWQFEERLISGMANRGYKEQFARQIFQQILGFGEYGFPESHSASFALLVYVSAWLKCHHPAAFTCALLNSQPMGFYAPSQLLQDARRHGVEVRPVDVTVSTWDCSLEELDRSGTDHDFCAEKTGKLGTDHNGTTLSNVLRMLPPLRVARGRVGEGAKSIRPHPDLPPQAGEGKLKVVPLGTDHDFLCTEMAVCPRASSPTLRLGLCMVKGLHAAAAQRIVTARGQRPFDDISDLARRAQLNRHDLGCLARAGALEALAGHRRHAAWQVAGIRPVPPLLTRAPIRESPAHLSAPTEAQEIVADYRAMGLSLRRHPLELLRSQLKRRRLLSAAEIRELPHGRLARAAGIVIGRQRPDTASGVIFVTMEDESGCVNVVVWHNLVVRQRRALLGARLLGVYGAIEREGEVVHLVAGHLIDLSPLLGALTPASRDFH
jgi:error-prone DNA polymerase